MVKLADTLVLEASTARCGGSSPPLGTKMHYTAGILIIIEDPLPTSLLNSIVPPCCEMILCVMPSPSPVPPDFVV